MSRSDEDVWPLCLPVVREEEGQSAVFFLPGWGDDQVVDGAYVAGSDDGDGCAAEFGIGVFFGDGDHEAG